MRERLAKYKKDIAIMFFLFLLLNVTYLQIGISLQKTPAFDLGDFVFGADTARVVGDLVDFEANHYRTKVHPLFVLLFNPVGIFLAEILNSGMLAALLLNSFFGALGIAIFYIALRKIGLKIFYGLIFSLLLGMSSAHLFFASLPETFIFSFTSLILLYLIFIFFRKSKKFIKAYIPASIFSMGITNLNIFLSIILFFFRFRELKTRKKITLFSSLMILILLIAGGLALVQKAAYPSSDFFLTPAAYQEDMNYFYSDFTERPARVLANTFYNFFSYNIIAPALSYDATEELPTIWLNEDLNKINFVRAFAYILYALLVIFSIYFIIKRKLFKNEIFQISVIYLIFSFIFHLFYGTRELFLFSPRFTFPIIILFALPFTKEFVNKKLIYATNTILVLLVIFVLINNFSFIKTVIDVYT